MGSPFLTTVSLGTGTGTGPGEEGNNDFEI